MVDLREANVGDYVMFKCGGHAIISEIYDDGDDDHCYPMQVCFKDYGDTWSYTPDGKDNTNLVSMTDITAVVPAYIVESEFQKKAEKETVDGCPF